MEAEQHNDEGEDGEENGLRVGCCSQGRQIIVGNTHLFFHPLADHIRLLQAVILEKELERLQAEVKQETPHKAAGIILCGDLNR